jgi:hypothetical protein
LPRLAAFFVREPDDSTGPVSAEKLWVTAAKAFIAEINLMLVAQIRCFSFRVINTKAH